MLSTPGFPPGTLTEEGCPIWTTKLSGDLFNPMFHLVRDLSPAAALELLRVDPATAVRLELPEEPPWDINRSLPKLVLGSEAYAVLVAGRLRGWTFVLDDSGMSFEVNGLRHKVAEQDATEPAVALSAAAGGPAVRLHVAFNALNSVTYAADGRQLFHTDVDNIDHDLDELPADLPGEVRAAIGAAGNIEELVSDDLDPEDDPEDFSRYDTGCVDRIACAFAGANWTYDELRETELIAVEVPQPPYRW